MALEKRAHPVLRRSRERQPFAPEKFSVVFEKAALIVDFRLRLGRVEPFFEQQVFFVSDDVSAGDTAEPNKIVDFVIFPRRAVTQPAPKNVRKNPHGGNAFPRGDFPRGFMNVFE